MHSRVPTAIEPVLPLSDSLKVAAGVARTGSLEFKRPHRGVDSDLVVADVEDPCWRSPVRPPAVLADSAVANIVVANTAHAMTACQCAAALWPSLLAAPLVAEAQSAAKVPGSAISRNGPGRLPSRTRFACSTGARVSPHA